MVRYGMAIDLTRCMGCRACMAACKVENNTTKGIMWMYVFRYEEGEFPNSRMRFMPRPCQHCDNPACIKVCPVGARFKRTDGIVVTDAERCIGCRYCEVACPYGVNYFNWKKPEKNAYYDWAKESHPNIDYETKFAHPDGLPYKNPDHKKKYNGREVSGGGHYLGVMEKCTLCVHRVTEKRQPACAENCPMRVYTFGDLDDPESDIRKLIETRGHYQLLEEMGTHPKVFYLGTLPNPTSFRKLVDADKVEVKP